MGERGSPENFRSVGQALKRPRRSAEAARGIGGAGLAHGPRPRSVHLAKIARPSGGRPQSVAPLGHSVKLAEQSRGPYVLASFRSEVGRYW